MASPKTLHIGTAGWTIPKDAAHAFATEGSHLERYARGLNCTEINSTFYRLPRASTLARWAAAVPPDFRFALKAPKAITHEAALRRCSSALHEFILTAANLADKLGPLLFQLPPKQTFDPGIVEEFLIALREMHTGPVVFEPRNASWFTSEAAAMLRHFEVARVAADPARVPEARKPGGWSGLRYCRLHGSPRTYYSRYTRDFIEHLAAQTRTHSNKAEVWCIFDNTASGAAIHNAQELRDLLDESSR